MTAGRKFAIAAGVLILAAISVAASSDRLAAFRAPGTLDRLDTTSSGAGAFLQLVAAVGMAGIGLLRIPVLHQLITRLAPATAPTGIVEAILLLLGVLGVLIQ